MNRARLVLVLAFASSSCAREHGNSSSLQSTTTQGQSGPFVSLANYDRTTFKAREKKLLQCGQDSPSLGHVIENGITGHYANLPFDAICFSYNNHAGNVTENKVDRKHPGNVVADERLEEPPAIPENLNWGKNVKEKFLRLNMITQRTNFCKELQERAKAYANAPEPKGPYPFTADTWWFNDDKWDVILDNAKIYSKVIKHTGASGVLFDVEPYCDTVKSESGVIEAKVPGI